VCSSLAYVLISCSAIKLVMKRNEWARPDRKKSSDFRGNRRVHERSEWARPVLTAQRFGMEPRPLVFTGLRPFYHPD